MGKRKDFKYGLPRKHCYRRAERKRPWIGELVDPCVDIEQQRDDAQEIPRQMLAYAKSFDYRSADTYPYYCKGKKYVQRPRYLMVDGNVDGSDQYYCEY